jgi:integrase
MASYLIKRERTWHAILEIPKALRDFFGKRRFMESLKTDSRKVAERLVHSKVADWKKKIAKARNEPVEDDPIAKEAAPFWNALRNAKSKEDRQSIVEQIIDAADDIGAINVENIGDKPSSSAEAQDFYLRATGQKIKFDAHLDEWLDTSRATPKTKDMHRSAVKRFAVKVDMVQDVTRPEVRHWITELMNVEGLTPKTVQRILSALRGYWRYLQSIEVANEDHEPFSKLDVARQSKQTSPRSARQPFTPGDVLKLLDAAKERSDYQLADLIQLGMWTGCRIEELCALKVEQVKNEYFSVKDAKTAAGWRDVPIHQNLAMAMARLTDETKDGYVLSGLTKNKYGDRSNAIGKRFGRLKKELGFGHEHVFHSIRKTVVTILENAGAPENVVADIVGHEKTTMTYGLYSGGLSLSVKAEALSKLKY